MSVYFATNPPPPFRGIQPIGHVGAADDYLDPAARPAVDWLNRLRRVDAEPSLVEQLCDMHRLIYLAKPFTLEGILRCLRLCLGRTQANWIEGCIGMMAAEEAANAQEDNTL
jgi:hypothetical protein